MAFCGNCGTKVEEGIKFCPSCGAAMNAGASTVQSQPVQPQPIQSQPAQYQQPVMSPATGYDETKDINDNKVMAILAYLGILVLVPLFGAKESKFARYHANQGLILAIVEIAYWIAITILNSILFAISWRLGVAASGILSVAGFVFVVFIILGIVNVSQGKCKELPVIGKFKILK